MLTMYSVQTKGENKIQYFCSPPNFSSFWWRKQKEPMSIYFSPLFFKILLQQQLQTNSSTPLPLIWLGRIPRKCSAVSREPVGGLGSSSLGRGGAWGAPGLTSPMFITVLYRRSGKNFLFMHQQGLPCWLSSKETACNAGDLGSIPGLRRSRRGGHGNPFQYPCLENSKERGTWWGPWGCRELDTTKGHLANNYK